MLSSRFAGIPISSSTIDGLRSAAVAEPRGANDQSRDRLRWPASFRNGGRHQIGTVADIKSESPAGLNRNSHGAVAQIDARFGAARLAASLGNGRRRKGRKPSFAISPAVSNRTGPAFLLRSWKGSTRCSPLPGSASPANCAARSPSPTSSRMSWAWCGQVCRNVKYWRSPSMALRWAAAAMHEAFKGFRRLKAKKHLPALRAALAKQGQQPPSDEALVQIAEAA